MVASFFRNRTWIIAILFFIVLIVISFFSTDNTPEQYPAYLIESPSPSGVKAFYTYFEQNEQPISQAKAPPSETESNNETRLLLNPPVFSDMEVNDHYMQYVENGNHLIIGKKNPDGLFNFETEYIPETMLTEEETTEINMSSQSYQVFLETSFRLKKQENDRILLEDEYGIIALERSLGEGKITMFLEPDWLTNEQITEHEHLAILFDFLPLDNGEPIIFDEFSVDMTGGVASQFEVYPNWAYVLLVEGLLITLLILWHQGKRFGTIQPVREETVRFSDERLKAIANWHMKGKNYKDSLQNQLHYLQDIVRERFGIPYHTSWQERITKLKKKLSTLSDEEWKKLSEELETIIQKESLTKQEYLYYSKKIDKIRSEVESG